MRLFLTVILLSFSGAAFSQSWNLDALETEIYQPATVDPSVG